MSFKRRLSATTLKLADTIVGRMYASEFSDIDMRWPKEIVVSGFFSAKIGIGRAAERTARQLERAGFIVHRHDVSTLLQSNRLFQHKVPGSSRDRAWILQVNGPEVRPLLSRLNPLTRPRGPKIGYWVWELPIPPQSWKHSLSIFDAIVAPSTFSARAISGLGQDVGLLPHPFSEIEIRSHNRVGGTDEIFKFFAQMDGASSFQRKNIVTVIEAFKMLPPNIEAELLIKTQKLTSDHRSLLLAKVKGDQRIQWIDDTISDMEMDRVMKGIDCVVSAHRAEGFGLALAEAVANGKDVLATGWSGNLEFMGSSPDNLVEYTLISLQETDDVYGEFASDGAVWADVSSSTLSCKMAERATRQIPAIKNGQKALIEATRRWNTIGPGAPIQFSEP